jgi:hypothetical protein
MAGTHAYALAEDPICGGHGHAIVLVIGSIRQTTTANIAATRGHCLTVRRISGVACPFQAPGTSYAASKATQTTRETIMIAHRRTWFYRLAGERFAHAITFKVPLTAAKAKEALRKAVGRAPAELWNHGE